MNTPRIVPWIRLVSFAIGAGLVFIGGRFLLAPETGETGFGLHYAQPNYAFHYIKGIRDVFSGSIIFLLAWYHYRHPLFLIFLTGSIIPLTDLVIVWQTPNSAPWTMLIHGSTTLTLWLLCYFLALPHSHRQEGRQATPNGSNQLPIS